MRTPLIEIWRENHGNVLILTLVGILMLGASILAYEQNRFTPVGFPDAESIRGQQSPRPVTDDGDQLLIEIMNAENDSGSIMVAIFADAESFRGGAKAAIRQTLDIVERRAALSIPLSVLPGSFVISAFHDKDNDRVLRTNTLGIPTERYGFSRDAWGMTGPPDFLDAVIDRPESEQAVTIKLR